MKTNTCFMLYLLGFIFIELSLGRTCCFLLYLNSAITIGQKWAQIVVFCHICSHDLLFQKSFRKCQKFHHLSNRDGIAPVERKKYEAL